MPENLHLKMVNFSRGAYIIVEGKADAEYFFIIRSGNVRVSKEVEVVQEEGGNVLGPGDFFGVVASMSGHSQIETVQALTDCSMISVHKDNFGDLIVKNTPVAMKIIQGFSRRMRYLDEALARMSMKESSPPGSEHLFLVGEFYAKQSQYNLAHYALHHYLKLHPDGMNAAAATERLNKIKDLSSVVHLETSDTEFNREYPANTMVFCEHMPGSELYIIQKGSVKITKITNNTEVMLAILKPGDIFGEMSLIEDKPRSASAITFEETQLLAVNRENFARMVSTQPQVVARLTRLLAERIWFIYKQLANTLLTNKVGRLYDALLIQLEKERLTMREGEAYTFSFGANELINMVGLPVAEGRLALRDLLRNPRVKIVDNKIYTSSRAEIEKQAKYYRKLQRIERSRSS